MLFNATRPAHRSNKRKLLLPLVLLTAVMLLGGTLRFAEQTADGRSQTAAEVTEHEALASEDAASEATASASETFAIRPALRLAIVVDEDNQPVAGAILRILGETAEEDFEAVSDENGTVTLPFPLPQHFPFLLQATNAERTKMTEQTWATMVIDGKWMVRLRGGVRIITGTVVDTEGKPAEGVVVASSFQTVQSEIVRTDNEGNFQFLHPGDVPLLQVVAFKKGVGMDILATEEVNLFHPMGEPRVTSPEKISDGPFRLQLAPIEPVQLRITNAEGEPLAGAMVSSWLIQKPPTLPRPEVVMWDSPYHREQMGNQFNTSGFMRNWFMVTTGEDGIATINSVPKSFLDGTSFSIQGPLDLDNVAYPAGDGMIGFRMAQSLYGNARDQWQNMEIRDGIRTVVLPRLGTVRGTVRLEDGTPVSGVHVHTISGGSGKRAVTNAQGEFLIQDNAHVLHNMSFDSDEGAASAIFAISVGDGSEEIALDVVLKPGIRLHGTVFMPDGTPAEGFRIDIREQDPNPPADWRENWERLFEHGGTKYMHDWAGRNVRHFGPDGTYHALLPPVPGEYSFVVEKLQDRERSPECRHSVYVRNIRLLGTETEFRLDFYLEERCVVMGTCTPAATIAATPTDETARPVAREEQTPWVIATDVPMSDNPMIPLDPVIKVLDADGNPMEGVEIEVRFSGGENGRFNVTTDEHGLACVKELETKQDTRFVVYAIRHSGYVQHYADWQRESGFPREHVFTMEKGVEVGGIVVDENNNPIQGARVRCSYDAPDRRAFIYSAGEATTDAEGRWSVNMAPESIRRFRLDVTHPDFMPSELTGVYPPFVQMRDKTSVVMLRRGASVAGIVLDPDGNPVQDAKVVVTVRGQEFSGQQPQRTSEEGTFRFNNWNPGPTTVYVAAPGFAPQTQEWSDPAETVEFRLEPGRTMRVQVLDMDGEPIPQARVRPFRWRGTFLLLGDQDLISPYTDDEGNWSWTWAPEDEVDISIIRVGYQSIRGLWLTPQDDPHVFRMRLPLEIRGQVTDAETGEVIRNITVITGGNFDGRNPQVASYWNEDRPNRFTDGNYRVLITEPRSGGGHHFRIMAEGYEPFVSEMFTDDQGSLEFDVRLTRRRGD